MEKTSTNGQFSCSHKPAEDHMICRSCGNCDESLDADDVCSDCQEGDVTPDDDPPGS